MAQRLRTDGGAPGKEQRDRNRQDSGAHSGPGKVQNRMLEYLRKMTTTSLVLWAYLIWYLAVVVQHFDATPSLWLNALGISAIMGTAYYLSARAVPHATRPDRWHVFRMYLMPFCVSSFAAMIKGHGFILVFHPRLSDNLLALGLIGAFSAIVFAIRWAFPTAPTTETRELERAASLR
jgi:hypothetical protein